MRPNESKWNNIANSTAPPLHTTSVSSLVVVSRKAVLVVSRLHVLHFVQSLVMTCGRASAELQRTQMQLNRRNVRASFTVFELHTTFSDPLVM
jgi:hypothetical protein